VPTVMLKGRGMGGAGGKKRYLSCMDETGNHPLKEVHSCACFLRRMGKPVPSQLQARHGKKAATDVQTVNSRVQNAAKVGGVIASTRIGSGSNHCVGFCL
jgi:hypothetical protein